MLYLVHPYIPGEGNVTDNYVVTVKPDLVLWSGARQPPGMRYLTIEVSYNYNVTMVLYSMVKEPLNRLITGFHNQEQASRLTTACCLMVSKPMVMGFLFSHL